MGSSRILKIQVFILKILQKYFYSKLDSQAVLVCFDLSDKKSFLQYHVIMNELKSYDL